jgi:lysophospholipase L1-like esterase
MKLLVLVAAAIAIFGYAFGVGRYEWPPYSLIRDVAVIQHIDQRRSTAYWQKRLDLFRGSKATADIVMLGDSLTELGLWSEYFQDVKLLNRGISGDTASGVLRRIEEVVDRRPKTVFLMIGINDLLGGLEPTAVSAAIQSIVETLRQHQIKVIVQSVLPVAANFLPGINSKVGRLNQELRLGSGQFAEIAEQLTQNGALNPSLTVDGLHLNGAGYGVWKDAITPYIKGWKDHGPE